jgi:hypothetical protein
MCTVSIVRLPHFLRFVVNRDEQRARALALPPSVRRAGALRMLAPTDPPSGGTWVACNETGLAVALLNVNAEASTTPPSARSRGEIVPTLMTCRSLTDVERAAAGLEARAYSPFRLVAVHADEGRVLELWPGDRISRDLPLDIPRMFTSSGLGDHHVEQPRRDLFMRMVLDGSSIDLSTRQDQFHEHHWPSQPWLSVHMSRADAWTVSRTTLEIGGDRMAMRYCGEPDWGVSVRASLPRT